VLRWLDFESERASVGHWALAHKLAPDIRYQASPKPVKRLQVLDLGALWQYDPTPHPFLPTCRDKQVLLNPLDDGMRYKVGARRYYAETVLAHFGFLSCAFQTHGLPLAISVLDKTNHEWKINLSVKLSFKL